MIPQKLIALHKDSLVRNSFYLMLATVVVSGFGFLFWVLSARLFTPSEIGLATTLIATMNLISILGLVGFNTAFIRFLSKSNDPDKDISTGVFVVGLVSFLFSIAFILFVSFFSPKLIFVQNILTGGTFVIFCVLATINQLLESVFLAFRSTKYTLMSNTLSSSIKMVFPLLFIGHGAIGVFFAAALAQVIGLTFNTLVLTKTFKYRLLFSINNRYLLEIWRYSSINYLAAIFNLLPISLLPIIITNRLTAEDTAYFYVSMMLGNLLYVIPWSAARSLFAEGAHEEHRVSIQIQKVIRINLFLLVPGILFLLFFGDSLLGIFGKSYAVGSADFILFVALAGIPIAINSTFGALIQIKKDPRSLVLTNIFYGAALISLTYVFLPLGLQGVGYAWIIGNCVAALVSGVSYFFADAFYTRLFYATYVPKTIITLKLKSIFKYIKNGGKRKTILFYPEKPRWYHNLYVIMHTRGYKISTNPNEHYDAAISFEDTTVKHEDATLIKLRQATRVINGDCLDISKQRVDTIFEKVFGYSISVDPQSHTGLCVQKSDKNATHDGKVITCPTTPVEGNVYQKLINNCVDTETVRDIRVFISGNTILFLHNRYRSINDRFDKTDRVTAVDTHSEFSDLEITQLLSFASAFKLDYGELDVLRDISDGKIYVVDANLTCGGPMRGKHLTKSDYKDYIDKLATSFDTQFLK